jgi:hypothetical protein
MLLAGLFPCAGKRVSSINISTKTATEKTALPASRIGKEKGKTTTGTETRHSFTAPMDRTCHGPKRARHTKDRTRTRALHPGLLPGIEIFYPLRHVSQHVVQAPRIGRLRLYGVRGAFRVPAVPRDLIESAVARRRCPSPGRIYPFGFAGQAAPNSKAVGRRGGPALSSSSTNPTSTISPRDATRSPK